MKYMICSCLLYLAVASAQAKHLEPFSIRVVEKPKELKSGESHTFILEIRNKSNTPLTLCLTPGMNWNLSWTNPDGSGHGMFGGSRSKFVVATNYDPETGEFTCKYFHYDKDDFITIVAGGTKRINVNIELPQECTGSTVELTFNFESGYDGSEIGIVAWTGKTRPIKATLPVKKA
ncbi:MAG: hypothetical protein AB1631_11135 [Acidobacteriota bacterium]